MSDRAGDLDLQTQNERKWKERTVEGRKGSGLRSKQTRSLLARSRQARRTWKSANKHPRISDGKEKRTISVDLSGSSGSREGRPG